MFVPDSYSSDDDTSSSDSDSSSDGNILEPMEEEMLEEDGNMDVEDYMPAGLQDEYINETDRGTMIEEMKRGGSNLNDWIRKNPRLQRAMEVEEYNDEMDIEAPTLGSMETWEPSLGNNIFDVMDADIFEQRIREEIYPDPKYQETEQDNPRSLSLPDMDFLPNAPTDINVNELLNPQRQSMETEEGNSLSFNMDIYPDPKRYELDSFGSSTLQEADMIEMNMEPPTSDLTGIDPSINSMGQFTDPSVDKSARRGVSWKKRTEIIGQIQKIYGKTKRGMKKIGNSTSSGKYITKKGYEKINALVKGTLEQLRNIRTLTPMHTDGLPIDPKERDAVQTALKVMKELEKTKPNLFNKFKKELDRIYNM